MQRPQLKKNGSLKDLNAFMADMSSYASHLEADNKKLQEAWEAAATLSTEYEAKSYRMQELWVMGDINPLEDMFQESRQQSLSNIKADAVEAAIADYKAEYMGQGVVVLLQSFADELRQGK